ncbi:hypothetical protein Misp01_50450 [Microtetraspora sp. NBRC 13810]|uniref:PIN-like domain-containing protein n=1 Tax=Microtetraspora sp. NBRC 13810 TaxID=3030990 RepID=UPI0024A0B143|nr:hypothetical protein [Microtetraspora sp. NBRC 13810]GLW09916.1 hypothetical protein Misp01_50450 [Microtetraspora sp. NBRC 13810]
MPPIDLGNLRFFVDETSLGIGKPLVLLRRDVIHTGHPLLPEVPIGTLDPDWMPIIAAKELVVITRDKCIRTKHAKAMLLAEHGLRIFWLAGKKDLSNWDTMRLLVRRWDEMEREIKERGDGPWFMAVSDAGIREMSITTRE